MSRRPRSGSGVRRAAPRPTVPRIAVGVVLGLSCATIAPTVADAQNPAPTQQPQAGRTRITGTVKDVSSGAPIVSATVSVPGTSFATSTNAEGQYTLFVPPGRVNIEARRLGYSIARRENVQVGSEPMTLDLTMNSAPLSLETVTVSASVDATSSIKAPFAVSKITAEAMPVPATAAASTMLMGKIAGVNVIQATGAPNSGSYIQLRTPSSAFKDNSPLWVVDGVMLNETQSVTTADIDAMSIESIEVIKGAAAAALYGSRAAGGVIAIKTNRGKQLQLGSSQITIRNDFGYDQFTEMPAKRKYHYYRVNEQGQYVNAAGQVVPKSQRSVDPDGMADNPYAVTYDNLGQLFRNGRSMQTVVSIANNSAATNYTLTFSRNRVPGIIEDTYGNLRQNAQFTLDHSIRDNLTVGVSGTHSRANYVRDEVSFTNLYRIDPDVNLLARDEQGNYLARPDSGASYTNPVYLQQVTDNSERRSRTLLSTNLAFTPYSWLRLTGQVGYDRGDQIYDQFTPPGLPDGDGDGVTLGSLVYQENEVDGLTGSLGATASHTFGKLNTRFTAQAESQRERRLRFSATGTDFQIAGIRDLAGARNKSNASDTQETRINASTGALYLDYAGKYVLDALLKHEGSSRFGPKHRWTNYYRVGGSYLMSDEAWFPKDGLLGNVSTFKLYYNIGTAGTQPAFNDQYSAISVSNAGFVRDALGNPDLRPEIKTDQEFGFATIIKNRLQIQGTYSTSRTKDMIVGAAAPSVTGYNTQEMNIGSMKGHTYELTVEGQVMQKGNFRWFSNAVFDRSRHLVEAINRPPYGDGIRWWDNGVKMTGMWGQRLVRSLDELRSVHANSKHLFAINDQGYVVFVGDGNTPADGFTKGLWGRAYSVDGVSYRWGEPFMVWDEEKGVPLFHEIGNGEADLRFGLGNRFNYGGFQVYFLIDGQLGGDVYNNGRQNLLATLDSPEVDQVGKSDAEKKPYYYYSRGLTQSNGYWLKDFIESGTHAKLRELQVAYQLTAQKAPFIQKFGADRMSFQLIGRNLHTWTKYTGLRVDGGTPNYRVDDIDYPISRNFTGSITLVF